MRRSYSIILLEIIDDLLQIMNINGKNETKEQGFGIHKSRKIAWKSVYVWKTACF